MRRFRGISVIVIALLLGHSGLVTAQSQRSTPAIERLFGQAVSAIEDERYIQATQILTNLIGQKEHVHSQQAQELLGNVREANGQLAHAVAEYQIYLEKYPDGPGATRVSARLNNILGGAKPVERQPDVATVVASAPTPARTTRPARPSRTRLGRAGRSGQKSEEPRDPNELVVTDRGVARLVYRYNEGATEITNLFPDPDEIEEEDNVFDNTITGSLQFSRVIENAKKKVTLSFSGTSDIDFGDSDDSDFRLYELLAKWEDKTSGRILTFGRQRMKPSGIAYRLDGVSMSWPSSNGTVFGVFAGKPVGSTRDGFLEDDRFLLGGSASFQKGRFGPGELTTYFVEQRDGSYTDRRSLGVEYDVSFDRINLFANAEVDLKFGELNRALVTGTRVFEDNSRLTGRVSFYRSPRLSLQSALIGQTADTLSELDETLSESEIEQLALDRSSKVTTAGLTYYTALSDTWNLSAFGSVYHTSGKPASGGVAEVEADGARSYAGVRFTGSSIFREKDQVSIGLRHSHSDDSDLYVTTSSIRVPVSDKLMVRPRVQLGYRDHSDGEDETFLIPSVNARYKLNRETNFQVEVGGRWSKSESTTTIVKEREFYLTTGVSRSF